MMPVSRAFFQTFATFFGFLKDYVSSIKSSIRSRYHIEEINLAENKLILRCRYSRSFIKTSLDDATSSAGVIEHLCPLQACWLGYYYALSFKQAYRKGFNEPSPLGFKLQMKHGRFKIVSYHHQSRILTYLDTKLNKVYKEPITMVVQARYIIEHIDPTQACYIGMQAGYAVNKYGVEILQERPARPMLKIVQ